MSWFNYIGLIVVGLLLIPNIVYAILNKGKDIIAYRSKGLEIVEQIGRFGSMILMVFNIPYTYMQFYFQFAKEVYIGVNIFLVLVYIILFVILWKKETLSKAIILSVIPSLIFIFSGVMIASIPLVVFALIFVISHIIISVKSALITDSSPKRKRNGILTIVSIGVAIIFISVTVIGSLIGYSSSSLNKLKGMSSKEMIDYCVYDKTTKISVAIIDNGSVTYHTYGVDGEEDMLYDYEIGSISKTYLGLLFSKAISEGKVQLNDSISKYLDLSSNRYYPTIERLLTHTSGYEGYYFESEMIATRYAQKTTNDFYGISREKILKRIQKVKLKDKDYEFKYSNFGISVLGLVLEKVYNKSFTEILTSFVKNDLGLNNTTVASYSGNLHGYWIWEDNDGYIPAGSIISTIKDMATYLKIYLDDSLPYAKQAITQIKKVDGNNPTYNAMNIRIDSIGMTWVHDDTNGITWHNGATGAFNTYIAFNDNKTKGVVILSNLSPTDRIPMTTIGTKLMLEIMN